MIKIDGPILFNSDHTFEEGEWIAFWSSGIRQTAKIEELEDNINHLWLHISNPDGMRSPSLFGFRRHCIDARRVTERDVPPTVPAVVAAPAAEPVQIRQRTRVRA
jgi:hypothetical protein